MFGNFIYSYLSLDFPLFKYFSNIKCYFLYTFLQLFSIFCKGLLLVFVQKNVFCNSGLSSMSGLWLWPTREAHCYFPSHFQVISMKIDGQSTIQNSELFTLPKCFSFFRLALLCVLIQFLFETIYGSSLVGHGCKVPNIPSLKASPCQHATVMYNGKTLQRSPRQRFYFGIFSCCK